MYTSKKSWLDVPDQSKAFNYYLSEKYKDFHNDKIAFVTKNKYVIIKTPEGDRVEEIKELVVHQFSMADVEDPDLYAAQPLYDWEKSDQGQWVMKHAVETPSWYRIADPLSMGYKYQIRAKLMGPSLTEWLLRYGDK